MTFFEKAESGFNWFTKTRFGRKFLDILYETAILIFYVSAIALLHLILDTFLGKDAMLLGFLKVGYIIDFGHILAIGLFFLEILKEIVNAIKEIFGATAESEK